jgi:hypothetical protein
VKNDHDIYRCYSCELTYSGTPQEGHYFEISSLGADVDDDNDFFIAGDKKIIVGRPTKACHNDDYPCIIDDSMWCNVICEMLLCDCGATYEFDNDYCTAHGFSTKEDAASAARRCACQKTTETIKAADKPNVGDLLVCKEDRAQGSIWKKGVVIKVKEVGTHLNDSEGWVLSAIAEPDSQSQGTWNIYSGSTEPYIDDGLADKFRPKTAEKKVVHIEF